MNSILTKTRKRFLVENKTIIVTGGGNGMGREMVLNLLERGNNVIALDINETALQRTEQIALEKGKKMLATFVVDITQKESIDALVNKAIAAFGQIDGIVNNAGIVQPFEKLSELNFTTIKKVFDVNFFGMLYLIKAFLPHLLSRPQAQIVNISSMGGFLPVPGQSVYCASKAAVKILSESLASELAKTNVHITTVLPGAIFTDIKTNSGLGKEAGVSASDYKTAPKGTLSPSVAVKAIIESVEQGKSSVCIGKDSKVMNIFYRLNPTFACGLINKKMKAHVA